MRAGGDLVGAGGDPLGERRVQQAQLGVRARGRALDPPEPLDDRYGDALARDREVRDGLRGLTAPQLLPALLHAHLEASDPKFFTSWTLARRRRALVVPRALATRPAATRRRDRGADRPPSRVLARGADVVGHARRRPLRPAPAAGRQRDHAPAGVQLPHRRPRRAPGRGDGLRLARLPGRLRDVPRAGRGLDPRLQLRGPERRGRRVRDPLPRRRDRRGRVPRPGRDVDQLRRRPHTVGHVDVLRGARRRRGLGVRPDRQPRGGRAPGDGALQARGGRRRSRRAAALPDRGPGRRRAVPLHARVLSRLRQGAARGRGRAIGRQRVVGDGPAPARRRRGPDPQAGVRHDPVQARRGDLLRRRHRLRLDDERQRRPRLRHPHPADQRALRRRQGRRAAAHQPGQHRRVALGRRVRRRGRRRRRPARPRDHHAGGRGGALPQAHRRAARQRRRDDVGGHRPQLRPLGNPPVPVLAACVRARRRLRGHRPVPPPAAGGDTAQAGRGRAGRRGPAPAPALQAPAQGPADRAHARSRGDRPHPRDRTRARADHHRRPVPPARRCRPGAAAAQADARGPRARAQAAPRRGAHRDRALPAHVRVH